MVRGKARAPGSGSASSAGVAAPEPAKRTGGLPNGNAGHAPVDRIERWPVARLVPYAKNPRLHSPEQVSQIAASMREFGQTHNVVVDDRGEIIAGHGRVLAAQQLGWEKIIVGVAVGWDENKKKACRIADNQLALTSVWDQFALRAEIGALRMENYDLLLLGFGEEELARLLAEVQAPAGFPEVGEDIQTDYCCPRCGYKWSGAADAGADRSDGDVVRE